MRAVVGWILALLAVVGLAIFVFTTSFAASLGERGFRRAVDAQVARTVIADLGPGLHVITVGTGAPLPDPARAGPMTAIVAGGRLFIVDAGGGAVRNLGRFSLPVGETEAVFLTHFHSDHIDGLGELMLMRWANGGQASPLSVYGPEGVETVVGGFNTAYSLDRGYRIAHHGEAVVPPSGFGGHALPFELPAPGAESVIYNEAGVRVIVFPVDHDPVHPAVGYRFEHAGRSVVITGDTAYLPALADAARGADILVHEVLHPEMVKTVEQAVEAAGQPRAAKIMRDIPSYHTTPTEAARSAGDAGVKMLVFSHIVPALPDRRLVPYFLRGTDEVWDGEIIVAEDGDVFSLPPESDAIRRLSLD